MSPSRFSEHGNFSPNERFGSSPGLYRLSPNNDALSSNAPPGIQPFHAPFQPVYQTSMGLNSSDSVATGFIPGPAVNVAAPPPPRVQPPGSLWMANATAHPRHAMSVPPPHTMTVPPPPAMFAPPPTLSVPTSHARTAPPVCPVPPEIREKPSVINSVREASSAISDEKDSSSHGVSALVVHHLLKQRCRFLRYRNKLEQRISQLKSDRQSDATDRPRAKAPLLATQHKLYLSLETDLCEVSSAIGRLDTTLRQLSKSELTDQVAAEVKKLLDVKLDCASSASQDNVQFLVLGDESLRMLSSYREADDSRSSFHTDIDSWLISLYSTLSLQQPNQEHCMNEVLSVVRRRAPVTVILLASHHLLHADSFSASATAGQLVALAEQLRLEGVYRVVIVGTPVQLQPSAVARARGLHEAIQADVRAVGGSQLLYQPITATDEEFGQPDSGTACKSLYKAVHLSLMLSLEAGLSSECVPVPERFASIEDAITATQSLISANESRLASTQTQRLRHVSQLLCQLRHLSPVREHLSGKNLDQEDTSIYFTDPADHICISCNKMFDNAKLYLQHLLGTEHSKNHQDAGHFEDVPPWQRNIPVVAKKQPDARPVPIKGLDMLVSVHCWYCKVCSVFIGDLRCASSHLKSRRHNSNYKDYLENHPEYRAELDDCRGQLLSRASSIGRSASKQQRQRQVHERSLRLNSLIRSTTSSNGPEQLPDDVPFQASTSSRKSPRADCSSSTNKSIKLNLLQEHIPSGKLQSAKKTDSISKQDSSRDSRTRLNVGDVHEHTRKKSEVFARSCMVDGGGKAQKTEGGGNSVKRAPSSTKPKALVTKATPIIGKMPCLKARPHSDSAPVEKPTPALSDSDRAVLELAARQEEEDEVHVFEDSDDCDQSDIQLLSISRDDVATSRLRNTRPPM